MTIRILFVCLGNICRSPTAEGIARKKLTGLPFEFDSAGTGPWHIGEAPDPRSQQAAAEHGYDLSEQRARQIRPGDFHLFDHIIAMDRSNLEHLKAMQPSGSAARLHLMLDLSEKHKGQDVPDPYYGNDGFDRVVTLLEESVDGIASAFSAAKVAE